ncbi:geminivirus rep catalytic domain-containing protein [Hirsutella rhossiliensis]|uniref:Geminivirus rep catalytic domain-containing protein n=1 Tax=Hirsutella rhossiliensis TaxID=111463 RepID=A0A9P8N8R3_9HYPO|nr:geminivirus rep catalytic domain-containing protein [Hirsutella rhossiliensis]KAH0966702.1 geminivirus rep catalytic domain-containing protein [Hirsutella rhossiliensis]
MQSTVGRKAPGGRTDFVMYADVVFVTYTRSRVHDKEEFHRCLRHSVADSLSRVKATSKVTVDVFGSRELHEDGTPHYHVVLRFSKRVYWPRARLSLSVWILVGDKRVVDTHSINIKKKRHGESVAEFLYSVQTYVAKGGDVFGNWIGGRTVLASGFGPGPALVSGGGMGGQ